MIVGNTLSTTTVSTAANKGYFVAYDAEGYVAKLAVRADGLGGGFSSDEMRAMVYRLSDKKLVAVGEAVTVEVGAALAWVDLPIEGGVYLAPDRYLLGVAIRSGGTIRLRAMGLVENFHPNPSVEVNLTGYATTVGGTGVTGTTGETRSGSGGAREDSWFARHQATFTVGGAGQLMTLFGQRTTPTLALAQTDLMPVTDGQVVKGGVSLRPVGLFAPLSFTLRYRFWDDTATPAQVGAPVTALTVNNPTPGAWVDLADLVGVAAPAGARFAQVTAQAFVASPPQTGTFEVDSDRWWIGGAAVGGYFDGDEDGSYWVGAADNSWSAQGATANVNWTTPPATLGALSEAGRRAIFGTLFEVAAVGLPEMDDEWYAKLGFPSAQGVFGDVATARHVGLATCGWHGSSLGEPGSFALVNGEDRRWAELVGERVRLTHDDRQVYAYVFEEASIAEDISLSRRLFEELALLATEEIDVDVEVV